MERKGRERERKGRERERKGRERGEKDRERGDRERERGRGGGRRREGGGRERKGREGGYTSLKYTIHAGTHAVECSRKITQPTSTIFEGTCRCVLIVYIQDQFVPVPFQRNPRLQRLC